MESTGVSPVPRIALTRREAAASLGVSIDTFERLVQPEVRMIRFGRIRLVPVSELERWVATAAQPVLPPRPGRPPLS
jgi:excisionase family DNA binding protein